MEEEKKFKIKIMIKKIIRNKENHIEGNEGTNKVKTSMKRRKGRR
jgi:hypothetical protein